MAENPYSKYTGSRISPVPAGYLTAAGQMAETYRSGLAGLGKSIGAGIAKYYEDKDEEKDEAGLGEAASMLTDRGGLGEEDITASAPLIGTEDPFGYGELGGVADSLVMEHGQADGDAAYEAIRAFESTRWQEEPDIHSADPAKREAARERISAREAARPAAKAAMDEASATQADYLTGLLDRPEIQHTPSTVEWMDKKTVMRPEPKVRDQLVEWLGKYGPGTEGEVSPKARREAMGMFLDEDERRFSRGIKEREIAVKEKPTAVKPSALMEKLNELDAMAKAADSRGTPWTTEKLEERRLEILDIAGAAGATAKVAEWNKFKETELWAAASDADKKTWTERFFVKPPEGDKTTLQKNILEFSKKLLAMKADDTWTEKGEAQLRKDYGLTSKAEIDLQDVTLQLKKRELTEGDFELNPVVLTLRDEAGNKLPYGLIKTSKGSAMYVQMNPGIGMDKSNFSIDANRLATMMKQYAASFSYKDDLGEVITRDMNQVSPQEKATIDALAMLIMGMQRNMGATVSSYQSVITPGTTLKPARPAPEDEKEVEKKQKKREKTEEEEQRDAMDRLKNMGAPNPNAPKR